jgi:hypothetical protein
MGSRRPVWGTKGDPLPNKTNNNKKNHVSCRIHDSSELDFMVLNRTCYMDFFVCVL